jgi:hypothetical protein
MRAEPGMTPPLNFTQMVLGGKSGAVVLRMLAHELAERQLGGGRERRIEADEQRLVFSDALQLVHPVAHGDVVFALALALPAQKIPRCPGPPALRHQPDVAVQIDRIGGIADGAEDGAFAIVRVGKHRERLIAVRGDHDVIVAIASPVTVMDDDAVWRPLDRRHGAAEPQLIAEGRGQLLPPFTVRQTGRSYCSRRWLLKKATKFSAGKSSISLARADQIAAPIGAR